jgi:retron-type reverse transcriptase
MGGFFERCFHRLDGKKPVGVDGISKDAYGQNLDQNLKALVLSIRTDTHVPKPDGTMRPLAISCFEDKIVQSALKKLLEVLYEPIFVDDSHGFRPGRGCDIALVDLRLDFL